MACAAVTYICKFSEWEVLATTCYINYSDFTPKLYQIQIILGASWVAMNYLRLDVNIHKHQHFIVFVAINAFIIKYAST